jgi:hypothetical protein
MAVTGQRPSAAVGGNIVSTDVSLSKPETLMPLLTGLVVASLYIRVIETLGHRIAIALGLRKAKVHSFTSAWGEAVYFTIQILISYRLFSGTDWFWPSGWASAMDDGRVGASAANGLAGLPPFHCTREYRAYYVCEFGYYTAMLFTIFFKKRKKDFKEMVFHHAVTSALILVSYANWHLRIGIVVMMLHNLFDPFLNAAKCAHYTCTGAAHVIADIFFGAGALTFAVTRILMYPYAIYVAWMYASPSGAHCIWDATGDEWFLKLLLCFLYPVHLYWFGLILKVAKKALCSGEVQGDDRSDSGEDDEVVVDAKVAQQQAAAGLRLPAASRCSQTGATGPSAARCGVVDASPRAARRRGPNARPLALQRD